MSYWVMTPSGMNGGAVLEKLPGGSPGKSDFFEAVPLGDSFPRGGTMSFSNNYPDFIQVFDIVANTLGLPIVSTRVLDVLTRLGAKRFEPLPVVLQDHKGRVASNDHCIIHILDVQDIIDMERSEYDLSPFDSSQIFRIKRLAVKTDGVAPEALLFRARTRMREVFLNASLHEALLQAGVTGLKAVPAEGWNGFAL
ncbi:hypothetical protein HPC49_00320 [Pyxidicoccus fallax]|uniref:Immunity MXAN-0049 protein domain-containing protein n=1 Tax=Pyxidicoccus fallax TaxID=394095 RepID=A0A848L5I9_9BACT|nr:DUF1629 domain-containing protein [Pyxidicoccus fallax]NMO13969.1 hypothetical protein [Pyxidicoccus fallax]NPC76699.1 hypothetical protein [Pyxidicoccus fallax]